MLLLVGSVGLMIWTIYLGWRLPQVYVSQHWKLAWVGLDTIEIIALLLTTWAAYQRRVVLIAFATAAGTMLILDAWFDVTTARSGDFRQSLLTAVIVEIPSALVLYTVAGVSLRRVVQRWHALELHPTTSSMMSAEIPRAQN
jgi:hypothetical protein